MTEIRLRFKFVEVDFSTHHNIFENPTDASDNLLEQTIQVPFDNIEIPIASGDIQATLVIRIDDLQ